MRKTIHLMIQALPLISLPFLLDCTDAYDDEVCQFTFIVTFRNARTDKIRLEVSDYPYASPVRDTVVVLNPEEDYVHVSVSTENTRDGCYMDCAKYETSAKAWISKDTVLFDSLLADTIVKPTVEFGDDFWGDRNTNQLESTEVIFR